MDERNFMYMFYGFAAVWVILALYVVSLVGRQRRIQKQVQNLQKMVEEREKR
jgi:CcmD family protein